MEGPSPERLLPAIATKEVRVFRLEGGRRVESDVADASLMLILGQRVLFMGRVKRKAWVKMHKMDHHIQIMWMKNGGPRAKKSFYSSDLGVPYARDSKNCSECWLERWCRGVIEIISEQRIDYSEIGGHVLTPFFDMCQGR